MTMIECNFTHTKLVCDSENMCLCVYVYGCSIEALFHVYRYTSIHFYCKCLYLTF